MRARGILGAVLIPLFATGCDLPSQPAAPGLPSDLRFDIVSGNGQEWHAGRELPAPLVVRAADGKGRAIRGAVLTWHVTDGGGSVFSGTSQTDHRGEAREWWTLGPSMLPDANRLEVRSVDPTTGAKSVHAVFTATAIPVRITTLVPDPAELWVIEDRAAPLSVRAFDYYGEDRGIVHPTIGMWTSSDPSVATFNVYVFDYPVYFGALGHSPGQTTFELTVEDATVSVPVTVAPSPFDAFEAPDPYYDNLYYPTVFPLDEGAPVIVDANLHHIVNPLTGEATTDEGDWYRLSLTPIACDVPDRSYEVTYTLTAPPDQALRMRVGKHTSLPIQYFDVPAGQTGVHTVTYPSTEMCVLGGTAPYQYYLSRDPMAGILWTDGQPPTQAPYHLEASLEVIDP